MKSYRNLLTKEKGWEVLHLDVYLKRHEGKVGVAVECLDGALKFEDVLALTLRLMHTTAELSGRGIEQGLDDLRALCMRAFSGRSNAEDE